MRAADGHDETAADAAPSTAAGPCSATDAGRGAFRWTAHPAREHPGRAALGLLLVAATSAAVGAVGQHTAWAVFAALVLVVALGRFYFPSRFELDDDGVVARYPLGRRRARWRDLRRFDHDDEAGVLGRRARASRYERGAIPLDFGSDSARVIAEIEARVDAARAASGPASSSASDAAPAARRSPDASSGHASDGTVPAGALP